MTDWDSIWLNLNLATMDPGGGSGPYGAIEDGAIAFRQGRIAWLGPRRALPKGWHAREEQDGRRCWMTPGLIDCHTHLVYGGTRADEFERRLCGASYEEIARSGGGILSTVRATRAASEEQLFAVADRRLQDWMAEGATTVEIKSGYGLDLESEQKMLRVARRLGADGRMQVSTTCLAAHALPPEFAGAAEDYIDWVCKALLPRLASEGLVDAVDAFCEGVGFTPAQTRRVFAAARRLGLPVKLHADQLSDLGGAGLAAEHQAWSADHLEYASDASLQAMASAGTVAVLLPGAFYFLRERQRPPLERLRALGIPIAVATDCNPGSSPCQSLLLMLNMACTLFGMTPAEALAGVTRHAASALGLADSCGRLAPGMRADCALWDIAGPSDLSYGFGANPCRARLVVGSLDQPSP